MAKGKSRGRKSWPPIKAAFLEAYRDQWEEARRVKKTPAFYDRLTAAFLARFGYDLGLYIDPENETEEWAIPLVEDERIPGLGGLVEEESKARVTWFESLRTVRHYFCSSNVVWLIKSRNCRYGATTTFGRSTTMHSGTKPLLSFAKSPARSAIIFAASQPIKCIKRCTTRIVFCPLSTNDGPPPLLTLKPTTSQIRL